MLFRSRSAIKRIGVRREETAIIGDRMNTDIISGIESEMTTILVLSGVTTEADICKFAYQPDYVMDNVGSMLLGLEKKDIQ